MEEEEVGKEEEVEVKESGGRGKRGDKVYGGERA